MPHAEDYEAALKRMGINPSDYTQVSKFQAALREKIGSLTRGQQAGFSNVFRNIVFSFPQYNVKVVTYTYAERTYTRYVLPGQAGLFGYVKASAYVEQQIAR